MTVTTAGTPEPLAPAGLTGKVLIQAFSTNTTKIAVGGKPHETIPEWQVVTNGPQAAAGAQEGFLLNAGETLPIPVEMSDVHIDAALAGEGCSWLYVG